jgi:hypothetical protein
VDPSLRWTKSAGQLSWRVPFCVGYGGGDDEHAGERCKSEEASSRAPNFLLWHHPSSRGRLSSKKEVAICQGSSYAIWSLS